MKEVGNLGNKGQNSKDNGAHSSFFCIHHAYNSNCNLKKCKCISKCKSLCSITMAYMSAHNISGSDPERAAIKEAEPRAISNSALMRIISDLFIFSSFRVNDIELNIFDI